MAKASRSTKLRVVKDRDDVREEHLVSARFKSDAYRAFKMAAAAQFMGTADALNEALALWFERHHQEVPASIAAKLESLGIK